MLVELAFTCLVAVQQPARDGVPSTIASGTATISGMVVTDDGKTPVRRARVWISDAERRQGTTEITDDSGRFTFGNLAAGRYTVMASKNAWVSATYGARRPGRPGTPITIVDGQRIEALQLRLVRGAVITGTVTDESGRPLPRVMVNVMRYAFVNGARSLVAATGSSSGSDDRGMYRIYGLLPGQYFVVARNASAGLASGPELRQTTDADIARALSESRATSRTTSAGQASMGQDAGRGVTYPPAFYPGTSAPSQASSVTVAAAEERGGIDFAIAPVPTSSIEGTVTYPDGGPASNIGINLISTDIGMPGFGPDMFRTARTIGEGRFEFTNLPPGRYTLTARANPPNEPPSTTLPPARPNERSTPSLWAMADVAVDGNAVGLQLTLQPGLTVTGRVHFAGALPPLDVTRLRVQLIPVTQPGQVNVGATPGTVNANGTFTITGLTPGAYRVSAPVPGGRPDAPGWTLASAVAGGREILDIPLDLAQSISDLVLTYTDRTTELSGMLLDPSGKPRTDHQIVVFATDRSFWTPLSRRVRVLRPTAEGRYSIRALPAGEYFMAAVVDIEDGEWGDPAFLQQLTGGSLRLTLGDGETKTQNLQVGAVR
jgi:uncharacterized protein (DUF2141 family)